MEEQKENKKKAQLSYEELNNVARQLSEQNNQLQQMLQNTQNVFRRLDYLFRVVEIKDFIPDDFKEACIKEIIELMTIPDDEPVNEEKAVESEESKELNK